MYLERNVSQETLCVIKFSIFNEYEISSIELNQINNKIKIPVYATLNLSIINVIQEEFEGNVLNSIL